MEKILLLLIVGILVLSGLGVVVTAVTNNEATIERHITIDNHPPSAPKIKGPKTVRPGTHELGDKYEK